MKQNNKMKNAIISRIRIEQLIVFFLLLVLLSSCEGQSPGSENVYPEADNDEEFNENPMILPVSSNEAWTDFGCDFSIFQPITDFNIYQTPSFVEPDPRSLFMDPVFSTCIIRITDHQTDILEGDPPQGLKNEYSRVQSFNSDETLLIAYTTEGNWYLYDANSLQPLGQLPIVIEPRWDAVNPNLLFFIDETRLMSYQLTSGEVKIVHEFADDFPGQDLAAVWTRYEGSPSINGRYWGLMAEDQDWMTIGFMLYDLGGDKVAALRQISPSEIDSVTISPLANYFLAYFDNACEAGQFGDDQEPCGLMVYDMDLSSGRGLLRIVGHSDLALDIDGNEVLVYQDIDTDLISMLDLASGEITPLLPIDFSHSALGFHFSGRAFDSPGWVLISTYNGSHPAQTWMDDQVFTLELVENGQVLRLAHTHSIVNEHEDHDYWAEPQASVNHDFTSILFTSNWGRSGTDQVDMYMIKLPADWMSRLH